MKMPPRCIHNANADASSTKKPIATEKLSVEPVRLPPDASVFDESLAQG